MPSQNTKAEFNQHRKSDKALFNIYIDLESMIKKTDESKNNLERSSTIKLSEHTLFFNENHFLFFIFLT